MTLHLATDDGTIMGTVHGEFTMETATPKVEDYRDFGLRTEAPEYTIRLPRAAMTDLTGQLTSSQDHLDRARAALRSGGSITARADRPGWVHIDPEEGGGPIVPQWVFDTVLNEAMDAARAENAPAAPQDPADDDNMDAHYGHLPVHETNVLWIGRNYTTGDGRTWAEEAADLEAAGELAPVREQVRKDGKVLRPITLGSDGRVLDGHHRLIVALELSLPFIPARFADLTNSEAPPVVSPARPTIGEARPLPHWAATSASCATPDEDDDDGPFGCPCCTEREANREATPDSPPTADSADECDDDCPPGNHVDVTPGPVLSVTQDGPRTYIYAPSAVHFGPVGTSPLDLTTAAGWTNVGWVDEDSIAFAPVGEVPAFDTGGFTFNTSTISMTVDLKDVSPALIDLMYGRRRLPFVPIAAPLIPRPAKVTDPYAGVPSWARQAARVARDAANRGAALKHPVRYEPHVYYVGPERWEIGHDDARAARGKLVDEIAEAFQVPRAILEAPQPTLHDLIGQAVYEAARIEDAKFWDKVLYGDRTNVKRRHGRELDAATAACYQDDAPSVSWNDMVRAELDGVPHIHLAGDAMEGFPATYATDSGAALAVDDTVDTEAPRDITGRDADLDDVLETLATAWQEIKDTAFTDPLACRDACDDFDAAFDRLNETGRATGLLQPVE